MKRALSLILSLTIIFSAPIFITACKPKEDKMYSAPTKIADYLYEINYTDYRVDEALKTIDKAESFGCSSVRNGNFYGRNFDYIFNDTPEFVVKVSATETRHASIGIATHFGLRENKMNSYDKELELIPNFTLDGINDCGVVCSHNVVAIESDNMAEMHTNPGAPRLHMLFIPRFVLDNASSVQEAISLLEEKDIVGYLGNNDDQTKNHYLHIMIADSASTCIVEFYQGEMIYKIVDKDEGQNGEVYDGQVMTNYYNNLGYINEHAMGTERYEILAENYSEGNTLEGMQNLLLRVQYRNAYGLKQVKPWYSESLTQTEMQDIELAMQNRGEAMETLYAQYWDARLNNKRTDANPAFWQTVHNSTYDMQSKKLYLYIQENHSTCYEFAL